jgi:hypothetical protein
MRGYSGSTWLIAPVVLALALMTAPAAQAQKTTLPPSMTVIKGNQAWWANQLRLGRNFASKTLVGLQNAPTDDGSPIDEGVYQNARDTYVLIRAARYGVMEAVRDDKLSDPILMFAARRVERAWHLSRTAVDQASSMPRQEYLTKAVSDLEQAMRLIDQILVTLP